MSDRIFNLLVNACSDVKQNVLLSSLGWWKIGGLADYVVSPSSVEEIACLMDLLNGLNLRHEIIGDGSNILFSDEGFRGVIVRISRALDFIDLTNTNYVRVGAGVWVPQLVRKLITAGYNAPIHAIGIPGTLGGLVCMNGGSLRQSIGESVHSVVAVDRVGSIVEFSRQECGFGYRSSYLQDGNVVIAEVRLELDKNGIRGQKSAALKILRDRSKKFPRKIPNCGSVFLSSADLFNTIGTPGYIIEKAGLRGYSLGGAEIAPEHGNFILNRGGASSSDVLGIIRHVRNIIARDFGVLLSSEVKYLPPEGRLAAAHLFDS